MEIVRATENDRDWILRHRVEMFRDMGMSEEGLTKTEEITREELENVNMIIQALQKNILIRSNLPPPPVVGNTETHLR